MCSALIVIVAAHSSFGFPQRKRNKPKPVKCETYGDTSGYDESLKEKLAKLPNVRINVRHVGDVTILDLAGTLEGSRANFILRVAVECQLQQGNKKILLNLKDVQNVDEIGLYELTSSDLIVMKEEGKLKLLNLTAKVEDLLTITKLLKVFDVYNNEMEAVDSFK
jgi:anti-sigma B factor antagonist